MRQINKRPEPIHFKEWKDNFRIAYGRDAKYDDLIQDHNEYLRLKTSILEEQGYICCYCEKQIGQQLALKDCDIEHFMPRHPEHTVLSPAECALCEGADMTYTNLFASCKGEEAYSVDHCNHKKDNWFSFVHCISPIDARINGMVGFRLDGSIFLLNPIGKEMFKHLNLSSYVLEEQRKEAFYTVLEREFEDEDLFQDRDYLEAVIEDYDNMQDGKYAEFCSMITYCLRNYYMS